MAFQYEFMNKIVMGDQRWTLYRSRLNRYKSMGIEALKKGYRVHLYVSETHARLEDLYDLTELIRDIYMETERPVYLHMLKSDSGFATALRYVEQTCGGWMKVIREHPGTVTRYAYRTRPQRAMESSHCKHHREKTTEMMEVRWVYGVAESSFVMLSRR